MNTEHKNNYYMTRGEITRRLESLKEIDLIAYSSMKSRIEKREEKKKQYYFARKTITRIEISL